MRTTYPVVMCDADDCTEWIVDYYTGTASNWRELMHGWHYEPTSHDDRQFCPHHVAEASS